MVRLLIVDDEDLEREGLANMISSFSIDINICGSSWDGEEALPKAIEIKPDIAITDVCMPVMDGITFVRELRSRLHNCFVLFISGNEDFRASREALALGANAWLVKPVNREELLGTLQNNGISADVSSRMKNESIHHSNHDRKEQIIRQVEKIVGNEIGGDLSSEAIAARIYLAASHLRRVFKNCTGMTLQNYVLRMRMERARDMLRNPNNRVYIVAAAVGYENTSYFCLTFKRFYGITPREFSNPISANLIERKFKTD